MAKSTTKCRRCGKTVHHKRWDNICKTCELEEIKEMVFTLKRMKGE